VEEVSLTAEDEYFPPPRELRELLAALDVVASTTLAAPRSRPLATDREVAASDVLTVLAG
jgi:4-hydroxy-3-methylbut-2-enyl diphosphate reductase